MITKVQRMNRFFMLVTAPFIGLLIILLSISHHTNVVYNTDHAIPETTWTDTARTIATKLDAANDTAKYTTESIHKVASIYQKTTSIMNTIEKQTTTQAARPEKIYNSRITKRLGPPLQRIDSNNLTLELYRIQQGTYNGYAMKVDLKTPNAMKMVLGYDKLGSAETTLSAVSRYGAIAGINAGGFADGNGKRYPLSTTVMNGQYINGGFEPSYKDLSFVGLSKQGQLIGGTFQSKSQLDQLEPRFGATFVPVLLKNGGKMTIPQKWQSSPARAARTAIGSYKDNQLLILVINGSNENSASGATLAELQNKLANLGVINAYNLDGGGSTSLIFNGRVYNNPADGQLRPVPTHFLFFR